DDLKQWRITNDNVVQIYNFSSLLSPKKALLNNKTLIAVGRLDAQKGFDILLDVWNKVNIQLVDRWILNIYGDGDEKEKLNAKIKNLKLSDSVFLKGVSNHISDEIAQSSIFVLSSRYEGFPMVLLESLSCGVPIVAFDCKTGPNEIIENNDCGYLVPLYEVDTMAEKILLLINNSADRKSKGEKSLEKSKLYSKKVIMNQWEKLFSDVKSK